MTSFSWLSINMSHDLALPSSTQQRMRREYQTLRQQSQQSHEKIADYVNQHSEAEQQALAAAAAALARKREALLQAQPMHRHRRQFETSQDGMLQVERQLAELQRQAYLKIQQLRASPAEKQALWQQVEQGIEAVLYSDDEMQAAAALRTQVQQALAGMGMAPDAGSAAGGSAAASTKCIALPG